MRVRGHGLGITSSRPGDIDSENHLELERGMVFVMHPNQYIPESGYLLCGETVVIGPHGAESLSARDAELDVIGA
jgi:Xaa-Pro aminopeptidase